MGERIPEECKADVAALPDRLRALANEIEVSASNNDQSFYDAMCDMLEMRPTEYTDNERKSVLEAMGSYWD